MKRRTTALLLAAALALTLCGASVLAAEESPEVTEDQVSQDIVNPQEPQAAQPDSSQAAEAAPTETEPSAEDPEEDAEAPQKEPAPSPDAAGTLSFANLDSRVRTNNLNYLILEESIAGIEVIDYEKLREDLRDQLNMLADYQLLLKLSGDSYAASSLKSNYDSLRETFDDLKDGDIQQDAADAIRQLQDTQNQVIAGAESLYIALLEMQNNRNILERKLAATNRTVQEMQTRYNLGQISALQLHQVTAGLDALKSGIATLDMNLNNYTAQMELMVGAQQTGKLVLAEAPDVTAEQVAAMDYEKDLATAKEKSYELYDAKKTLDDARKDFNKEVVKYVPGFYKRVILERQWEATQLTYENTVQNFELNFRTIFNSVADYQQIVAAKESALSLQQDTFQATELKYQQGKISKNDYLAAQDDLESAKTDVITAKHNLFTAYRTYHWAVDFGVLN